MASYKDEDLEIVNVVFRGSLLHTIDLKFTEQDLLKLLPRTIFKVTLYRRRPFMLCVQRSGVCLTVFASGRFRIMGRQSEIPRLAYQWFTYLRQNHRDQVNTLVKPFLTLQTCTVKFRVSPLCARILMDHYPQEIFYEPEVFTAIRIKRWPHVHINLFFTGNVIVLGREAYSCAVEAKRWLEDISRDYRVKEQQQTILIPMLNVQSDPLTDAIDSLVKAIPSTIQKKKANSYFKSFPRKLLFAWCKRLRENDSSLIPYLCRNIGQYSA